MKHLMSYSRGHQHPLWLLLLLFSTPLGFCAPPTVLDLSYKHFLEASKLQEAIAASIDKRPDTLEVDISNSLLGNEKGFQEILQILLPKDAENNGRNTLGISFVSRHNRITPKSMNGLFQVLLNSAANTTSDPKVAKKESQSENSTKVEGSEVTTTPKAPSRPWSLNHLDVGWNALHTQAPGWKNFLKSLQKLLQTPEVCPKSIHFERCGLGPGACRAIGKGIITRYANQKGGKATPLSLRLCGNPDLGDSGSAAIAAAIRTVVKGSSADTVVLDTLDLSACGIGDAGAEALALALESSPKMCIRHLDLSNNQISDVGAAAIGHALLSSGTEGDGLTLLESLDLSGHTHIKDEGATAIADAVGKGHISCTQLRSCHILADGAMAFGKAVVSLAKRSKASAQVEIDLSGNPLGVLRGKSKKGGKYSASAIKSKATATTAAYMSIIQKGIKKGLKDVAGVDVLGNSGESDDEEEARSGMGDEDVDPSKARCGIKAFSNAILDEDGSKKIQYRLKCKLGLRRCFLDHGAADALAAVLVQSKEDLNIDLSFDLALNPVLEEEMIDAIQGNEEQEDLLREMSDRYLDALEALRESRERTADAARAAAARIQAERDFESQWDPPGGFETDEWGGREEEDYDDWDSDADYEADDEYDY